MASPLEIYSKFVLAIRLCSAEMIKLVRKRPMANLFQALLYKVSLSATSKQQKINYTGIAVNTLLYIATHSDIAIIVIMIIFSISILSCYHYYRTVLMSLY